MKAVFSAVATAEFDEAFAYYQLQSDDLADRFSSQIKNEVLRIQNNPFGYKRFGKASRVLICSEFPYKILYEPPTTTEADLIRILAIFHHSRNPRHLRGRR